MANISSINGNPIVVPTAGIEDGAVTDPKLAQSGGVLSRVSNLYGVVFTQSDNINDEQYELGGMWDGKQYANDKTIRTVNYIPVTGGSKLKAYAKYDDQNVSAILVSEYDSAKSYIKQGNLYCTPRWTGYDITLDASTEYIKFATPDEIEDNDISLYKIAVYYEDVYVDGYIPHLIPAWQNPAWQKLPECGLKVSGDSYLHFTKASDKENIYICREFRHVYVNHLLQLYKMYYGSFINGDIVTSSVIGTSFSDVVGPISVHRGDTDGYVGVWSGGTHGKTVGGVEYPTAKENDMSVFVDGVKVTQDGTYIGKTTIITENYLYFPQTITGADLSGATKALTEQRVYTLDDKMNVRVFLTAGETKVGVSSYYGCQCNTYDMDNVWLPNCEKVFGLKDIGSTYYFEDKETGYFCSNSKNAHYDVMLKEIGLGTFAHNDGTSELKWGNVATFYKIYFQLIHNAAITAGGRLMWEADYDYYID